MFWSDLQAYVKQVFRRWWSSLGSAVFTIIALICYSLGDRFVWIVSLLAVLLLLGAAMFEAWRAEYQRNCEGADLLVEWHSESGGHDQILILNENANTVLNVKFCRFSNPELVLHDAIFVPRIDAKGKVVKEVVFFRKEPTQSTTTCEWYFNGSNPSQFFLSGQIAQVQSLSENSFLLVHWVHRPTSSPRNPFEHGS